MKSASSIFKVLAKRHHLVLARHVPVEESPISLDSILSYSGSVDGYLAHGAVGHSEVSISLRKLPLRPKPKSKVEKIEVFAVTVPHEYPNYMLIVAPEQLPEPLMQLVHHSQGTKHKGLSDASQHQVFMKHVPQPEEQAYARHLAAKLPEALNLEKTARQLVLFTTEMPDSNQAEHIIRLAIELS